MSLRPRALLLVLAAGVLAILGQWGARELATLWRLPAALLLLGLAYEGWHSARAAPQLRVLAPAQWLLGRPTALSLELRTSWRRTALLELALTAPLEFTMQRAVHTLRVPGQRSAVLALSASARRLGRYSWPVMPARLAGVLGLAWWSVRLSAACQIQVVPDALREAEFAPGAAARGPQAMLRLGAGAEVLQLRDYRPNDAPRDIDWKASARLRRLTSRDYAEEQHLEIVLAIDIGRASGLAAGTTDRLALYANIAARFAQRALALEDSVGLLLFAERPLLALAPAHGTSSLLRLRAALASMQVQSVDGNVLLAAASIRTLLRQRGLVVVLTDLDDAGAIPELSAATRLLLPKHLPFIAGVRSTEAAVLARASVHDATDAYRALAAQEYLNGIERNVRALRALGAAAVLSAPQTLEQAVMQSYLEFRRRRRVA
ncbi:MAG TPA: DUF58 domain-containing protein [Steroidobacteraceae bacterium]|jgi:uncharacterized protein (DUF58 family)|nr:DUF58 domain-containing protein [Steroidobacteraceae bacterium]